MLALLRTFSWQELRRHPWRSAAAALAVMLGVALAFSVHLINASALSEFSSAVRSASGQPDLELRAVQGSLDENLFALVAAHEQVAAASPVLEIATLAVTAGGQRKPIRVIGVDALIVASVAPTLMPMPAAGIDRFAVCAVSGSADRMPEPACAAELAHQRAAGFVNVVAVLLRDVLRRPCIERQRQLAVARFKERPAEVIGIGHGQSPSN